MSDEPNKNTSSTLKVIFWGVVLMIGAVFFVGYLPYISNSFSSIKSQVSSVSPKEVDSSIFITYNIKDSNVSINSYDRGIVFESIGDYKIDVLKDDMGYIITPTNSEKPTYFTGKGWFYLVALPIKDESTIIDTN